MWLTYVVPLFVEKFLKDFLPVRYAPTPLSHLGFANMAEATSEEEMREIFVKTANSLLNRFIAFDASNIPSSEAGSKCHPQVSIYDRQKGFPASGAISFQTMELFVDFRHGYHVVQLPIGYPPQISSHQAYARFHRTVFTQQTHQFRTFIFTVGIFGKFARLFRWDPAGCQATLPIDYSTTEGNRQLTELFLRLDRMADDPETRGWDMTVREATVEGVEDFDQAVKLTCEKQFGPGGETKRRGKMAEGEPGIHPMFRKLVESVGDSSGYPRRKMSILDGFTPREYVVGCPASLSNLPTGRATRGFVAMSVETKKLVFLKDTWRADVASMPEEDHWYRLLKNQRGGSGLKNIGVYMHGSDVFARKQIVRCPDLKQRTIADIYSRECGWGVISGCIHHRVIQSELYIPLQTFRDSEHLTRVMFDIVKALEHVHGVGIFHCDLSIGNIMIDVCGRGRLIDFDIARLQGSYAPFSGGALQFIPTRKLLYPGKIYEVSDELESWFFVFLYMSLHLVLHNKPAGLNVRHIFDEIQVEVYGRQARAGSGKYKLYSVDSDVILRQLVFQRSPPLTDLIRELFCLFRSLTAVAVRWNMGGIPSAYDVANVDKLRDCKVIITLMEDAMKRKNWPEVCDKAGIVDCSPGEEVEKDCGPARHAVPDAAVPVPAAPLSTITNTHRTPERGREEDDDDNATLAK